MVTLHEQLYRMCEDVKECVLAQVIDECKIAAQEGLCHHRVNLHQNVHEDYVIERLTQGGLLCIREEGGVVDIRWKHKPKTTEPDTSYKD